MSMITTRTSGSTVLSILKPSHLGGPRTSLHRVTFRLPRNIQKIFQDYKDGTSRKEYEDLVCTLRDSDIGDNELLKLLSEAHNCVSMLTYDMRLFIQVLIILNWSSKSDIIIESYKEFIHDIVSAHAHHTKLIVNELVKLFLKPVDEYSVEEWTDGRPTEECEKQIRNIHIILQSILETRPMSVDILLESIRNSFPYYKMSAHKQESYVYNILNITKYRPDLRSEILQIIIDKIITLDVNSPKEDIIECEEEPVDPEMTFAMEVDEPKQMRHSVANTLDIVMRILFDFMKNQCYSRDTENLNIMEYKKFYKEFYSMFEHSLLVTHASHHVQFLMFYLSSFKSVIAENFLRCLWEHATSVCAPPVIRKSSINYLASYLARANFISSGCLKLYLKELSDWAVNYITRFEGSDSGTYDVERHGVFYSICQALFYLIAFRHKDLVDSRKKLLFLQSLNLTKIVTCQLNPLRVCLPAVAQNFSAVTRAYQLVYCYTIMQRNARNALPIVGRSRGSTTRSLISQCVPEVYFPFDPYLLLRTRNLIQPLYREYQASFNSDVIERNEEHEDDDDFIQEQNLTNISMIANKHSNIHDFSYSTSPGFKHNMSF